MNATPVATPLAPTSGELAVALQDMVRQLLLDAPSVQAATQPLCLCWVESQD
ncbi:hypothetical protein GTR02_20935 [Kineococcus sp. R8]|uniref:hypothetical protein n=1 Tax=Kineococcus siccus TaxID=2696567 RepID=UPI0014132625|nr:hypothetical protein [Kineococcus siccus]NAZ84272.1 hypothetical protein [Kineococcus siccus]